MDSMQNDIQIIEEISKTLLSFLGMEGEIQVVESDGALTVMAKTKDAQMLVGEGGRTLEDIQYILKFIARKRLSAPIFVSLDINEYRKAKEQEIRDLARSAADEVILFHIQKELPPMGAGERRIIHMELQGRADVETESSGEGEDRRVVVRPKQRPTGSVGELVL